MAGPTTFERRDLQHPPERCGAGLHVAQAVAAPDRGGVEADSVVVDDEAEPAIALLRTDPDLRGLGVACDVGEDLAGDLDHLNLILGTEGLARPRRQLDGGMSGRVDLELPDQLEDRRFQPALLDEPGAELEVVVADVPHDVIELLDGLLNPGTLP